MPQRLTAPACPSVAKSHHGAHEPSWLTARSSNCRMAIPLILPAILQSCHSAMLRLNHTDTSDEHYQYRRPSRGDSISRGCRGIATLRRMLLGLSFIHI